MPDAVPVWFDHVRSPLALTDETATMVLALNEEARRLFVAPPELPVPPRALATLIGEAAASMVAGMARADTVPPPRTLAAQIAGKVRTLGLALSRLEDGRCLLTIQDRMVLQEDGRLSAIMNDIQDILETLPIGVEIYDLDGICQLMNSHGAKVLGYDPQELKDLDDWWPRAYPDPAYRAMARGVWESGVQSVLADPDHVHMADWMVTCKDGSQKMMHFRLRSLGEHLVLAYWDVSDHRQLVTQLRRLADTDELTGLLNRRRFLAEAEAALVEARKQCTPVALLMIDLDFFKAVNDQHGHGAGDALLRAVADKCHRTLGEHDFLARLGGEEFAALLPGASEADAYRLAETLRKFIAAAPMLIEGASISASVSIGLAMFDPHEARVYRVGAQAPLGDGTMSSSELSDLLRRADEALYAAKRGGRNRVARDGEVPDLSEVDAAVHHPAASQQFR